MIILDTNVVSEAMKSSADQSVTTWLNSQVIETVFLSSVTLAELLYGIGSLPDGRRKTALSKALDDLLTLFHGRILAFDAEAARAYGELATRARAQGKGFPTPDGYIAAIAASKGFSVASRDTGPFKAANVPVINPWHPGA